MTKNKSKPEDKTSLVEESSGLSTITTERNESSFQSQSKVNTDDFNHNLNVQHTWKSYVSSALGFVGAFGAGATTYLLHNNRKISQAWNLTNALCRSTFGPIFELSEPSFRKKVLLEIWKIVCNGSYVITTLDVNKLNTIFSDDYNYSIDEFPNLKPFVAFEVSAISGFLSGVVGLGKLVCTTEDSTANKALEKIQKPFDLFCPLAAAVGAGFLFVTPGLDSPVGAPILCSLDGILGVSNFILNQFVKKESFSTISPVDLESEVPTQVTTNILPVVFA